MIHHAPPEKNKTNNTLPKLPQLSFYMPSGEQVSFCAHAAMGAALEICLQNDKLADEGEDPQDEVTFSVANLNDSDDDTDSSKEEYLTTMYEGDIVALHMKTAYQQTNISQPAMLFRMLRDYCAVDAQDLASTPAATSAPSYEKDYHYINCHASIARPKTLLPMRSVDLLQKAVAPKPGNPRFALTCSALDDTTGLYLYAKSTDEDGAWECRQFPRASGYPEDPATGIAAAALACHLHHHLEMELPAYKFYQGTAMGKPSLVVVDELEMTKREHDNSDGKADGSTEMDASFRLLGRVEIDERDTLEIDD